ncbi:hypothetical protein [Brevibacillus invocatus]|uniref:hypothetical protein n=1 Tax=Brevibacillus invocatus TaxID=173959 RepID=UPI00203F4547|nr:hypothetical protein [Brevibacillus invocatus]MCM3079659.1 hypothetical protein [Brevibacillus invocatus]MCM3431131.1 hypothetical protein [Brevibacillus invocatus]
MNIYLDESRLNFSSLNKEDIYEIIVKVNSENKVIIRIYNQEREFESIEQAVLEGQDFYIDTADSRGYLLEILENVSSYLVKMITAIENLVESFRIGEEGEATKQFLEIVDGLGWLLDMATNQQHYIKQNQIIETEVVLTIKHYEEILVKIVEAWEKVDFVLIADLLEYELIPWFEEYKEWSSHLQKGLSVDASSRKQRAFQN